MPSQSVLEQKKAIVAELSERIKNSVTGVVVSYEGINTEDDTKLRKELRENNVQYTVVKNTLLSRACDEVGLEDLKPVLEGTTAIATSDSEYAAAARILCNYAKDHDNFKVKSAYLDGAVIDMDTITAPLIHELIDHIDVYEAEGKGKNKTQRVVIHYNFVGYLEIPESDTPCFTADTRQGVAIGYISKPTEKSA